MLPGIGRDWSFIPSLTVLFVWLEIYLGQFESLLARWARDEWEVLEPAMPRVHIVLAMVMLHMQKIVGAKELELVGVSSGSWSYTQFTSAAGGTRESDT